MPVELFTAKPVETNHPCLQAMEKCIDVLKDHQGKNTLHDANGKVNKQVIDDLAKTGYWGMLIEPQYGGQGASVSHFMRFLSRVATFDPTIAGLASVHGCIGAVDPVRSFGTEDQKKRFLPKLASGQALSGFALTEPGAGWI